MFDDEWKEACFSRKKKKTKETKTFQTRRRE